MGAYNIAPAIGVEIKNSLMAGGEAARQTRQRFTSSPWNWSLDKFYRVAKEFGYESGRKPRVDKGAILKPGITEEKIEMMAAIKAEGTRNRSGKPLTTTEDACLQMVLNGHDEFANVSTSTLNRLLRDRKLSHKDMMAGTPAIEMRTLHPNHVHFIDASICVQWDFRHSKKMIRRDMQKAFYKNKPGYWKEVRKVLIRWLLVDGCSGAFFVKYTYASGENKVDLMDFMFDAWTQKPYAERYPFLGVPNIVVMDKGAWNISPEVTHLLDRLGVKRETHAAGNPRASGAVETIHNFWERRFEYELLFRLADGLDDLNARALDRMIYLNATHIHDRHGKTRSMKWREIHADQLRLLPPVEHCRRLATSNPENRTSDERLRISFDNRDFQLRAPALKGRPVTVELNPWEPDALIVTTEDGELVPCRLIEKDQHGYDNTAPVWGEGKYRRHADPPAEALRHRLEAGKDEHPIEIKPTAHLAPRVSYMPVNGSEIQPHSPPKAPLVPADEVTGRLRRDLGVERFTVEQNGRIKQMTDGRDVLSAQEYAALKEKVAQEFGISQMPEVPPGRAMARAG